MTEWDAGYVAQSFQALQPEQPARDPASTTSRQAALDEFRTFLLAYRDGEVHIYREALRSQYQNGEAYLEVDLEALAGYSSQLHDLVVHHPNEYLPIFEQAAQQALVRVLGLRESDTTVPAVQIVLYGEMVATTIRRITATDVNRLVQVPGIVINASRTSPKASRVAIKCRNCGDTKSIMCTPAFGGYQLPRRCAALQANPLGDANPGTSSCPLDPYVIVPDRCEYVDQQTIKLQEAPEHVPTGEMPRHLLLSVERALVDRVSPGTRVSVLGVVSIMKTATPGRGGSAGIGVRQPYVRVVGIMVEEEGAGRAVSQFTEEEIAQFNAFAARPRVFDELVRNVAPAISGDYTTDIKKAILCLLFAGSRKLLPDGMKLRGDINVLLLGDPSTAKSQFLKFVEKVAPVGVYTSGKGSSAAGLTASVIRDQKGEFYLEGGAMVLADGGVVCIDEFDKMREEDRVAIHEAMEQQTISIAKAGITTILNSRSAVLAAANPVFGRYDDERSAAENIDFLPTILSRFDLIFIVRDVRNAARDAEIARHVMRVHINASAASSGADAYIDGVAAGGGRGGRVGAGDELDLGFLKRFISYARAKCAPRLSATAAKALRDNYVEIRNGQRDRKRHDLERKGGVRDSVVPITVRQLEALVRISESLAKMTLSAEAGEVHVAEAIRLFQVSTLDAANSGLGQHYMTPEVQKEVQRVEGRVRDLLPLMASASTQKIKGDLTRVGFSDAGVNLAFRVMVGRGELAFMNERRTVRRLR